MDSFHFEVVELSGGALIAVLAGYATLVCAAGWFAWRWFNRRRDP